MSDDNETVIETSDSVSTNDDPHLIENNTSNKNSNSNNFAFDSLESVRKKLLDLSGRNTLLNYKHPKSSSVRLIDELPDQIYEVLDSGKIFSFIPVPEPTELELIDAGYIEINSETKERIEKDYPTAEQWAKHKGFDTHYDLPPAEKSDDGNKKHHDTNLQTLLYAPELESRLRSIRSKSETAIEESGGNILYLALGFLELYESRESDAIRVAPLFTLPVRLEKSKLDKALGVYRYTLTLKDDGLLSNVTLREKLLNDFDIALPLIDDDETPENYFIKIQNTILKSQPRWSLRRQATLVLLNFSKQAMYQDLNPKNWPKDKCIDKHELIKMFFSTEGNDESAGLSFETEHPIDTIDDIHEKFPLIYDADSSQHSALIDVVNGQNLVIEGPPGSGKSQTITNLIAACIANGKKVLFVAEKMAALDVVKRKLDLAGLGDFCIELHSHKTHKLKILQDLTTRLNNQDNYKSPGQIKAEIKRYDDLKGKLQTYVEEINSQWGNTDLSIHDILNKATRYREYYGINPDTLKIEGIDGSSFTVVKQKELIDQADMLSTIYYDVSEQAEKGCIENHFWYGVNNYELKGYQLEELNSNLKEWSSSLSVLEEYWAKVGAEFKMDLVMNTSLDEIKVFTKLLEKLPVLDGDELLSNIEYIHGHHQDFIDLIERYKTIHEKFDLISQSLRTDSLTRSSTLVVISDALKCFRELGLSSSYSIEEIKTDTEKLLVLEELLGGIRTNFDEIKKNTPDDIKICFETTFNGLNEFSKLIPLINQLPSELWRFRDEVFDNPDVDDLLKHLTIQLKNLTPIHQELLDKFSLHRLPKSYELIDNYSIYEKGGFFRILSSSWRNAKGFILNLAATQKPDKKILFNLVPDLIIYTKGIEDIDKLNKSDPVLKELYKGIETPIDRINGLRKWYQSVRNEYGLGFGSRVAIGNALLKLDRNLAVSIADVSNHGLFEKIEESKSIISELTTKYIEYHPLKNVNTEISHQECPLAKLRTNLSIHIDELLKVAHSKTLNVDSLIGLNSDLTQLQENVSSWLSDEVISHLVSESFSLSAIPGEYSKKLYSNAIEIIKLSKLVSASEILKKGVFNNSNVVQYNNFRNIFTPLNRLVVNVYNNEKQFSELGEVEISEWLSNTNDNLDSIRARNQKALSNPNWLNTWIDYIKLKNKLYSQGLANIISGLESSRFDTNQLSEVVQLVVFHQLSEEILKTNSYLSEFTGMEQMAIRKKFQQYDRTIMDLQRKKIAFQASRGKPPIGNSSGKVSTYSEISLIKYESGKKVRHIAVRNLLRRSGKAIQALKPCFMMSPMSVAQYLIPGQFDFDLVVMDEASQIRPEDALGAIARANKLVVVGDPKQLPPTNFFNKIVTNDDDDDVIALEESESILESVIPMFKTRRLRWHYRSRHESLIAFSNKYFYDSNLILFPSPFQKSDEFGIRFKRVERGRFNSGRNVEEAREVAAAAAKHLKEHPDESVGIVAMNTMQQAEIEMHLDQLAKDDDLLSDFLDKNKSSDDPIFIKNLENVQGDERDVIIISMTYGPEQIGGQVMQRFGPINTNVGWRRLNVLFTRSKKRMYIFSSMGSANIKVLERSSRGVTSLKYFLEYCERGHLHHTEHTGRPADSDFEIAVMHELAKHGYECEPQVGVAGYYLDLAVKDPGLPGKFLMGIECDGATYHSAKSARDRDRLRQDILESLGWKIRRIWSTDWFKNPQAQIQPIIRELDKLRTPRASSIDVESKIDTSEVQEEKVLIEQSCSEEVINPEQLKLDDDIDLRSRLLGFNKNVILKKFSNVDDEHHFLRPAMVDALLHHLPCSKAEFLEQIPAYLRTGTDVNEAKKYIEQVLEIITDYG